jgi:hypothetical protein
MTWNLGGLNVDRILTYLEGVSRDRDHGLHHALCLCLQEVCTREETPPGETPSCNTRENQDWRVTFHRGADDWRGVGVAVRKREGLVWGAQRRGRCYIRQKLNVGGTCLTVTSAHLPCTARLLDAGEILDAWGEALAPEPGWTPILGADLNETFTPNEDGSAVAHTSRGTLILQVLGEAGLHLNLSQPRVSSYHPYNLAMRPRRLDYMATDHSVEGWVAVDHRHEIQSDHDPVGISLVTGKAPPPTPPSLAPGGTSRRRAPGGLEQPEPGRTRRPMGDAVPPERGPHPAKSTYTEVCGVPAG